MGDFYDFINHWIGDFCAGSKMPIDFRKQGTMLFAKLYNTCTQEEKWFKICNSNEIIYRVQTLDEGFEKVIDFNNLYYSFSNDLDGLANVIKYDKNLRTEGILIIESKPNEAINLNELLNDMYEDYSSRYTCENEIISRLDRKSAKSIYYLKGLTDCLNYKKNGVEIDLNDTNLSYTEFVQKYHL